jgi:hypothetical protein
VVAGGGDEEAVAEEAMKGLGIEDGDALAEAACDGDEGQEDRGDYAAIQTDHLKVETWLASQPGLLGVNRTK